MNLDSIPKLGFATLARQVDIQSEASKESYSSLTKSMERQIEPVNFNRNPNKPLQTGFNEHGLVNLLCDLKEGPDYLMEYLKYQIFQLSEISEFLKKQSQVEKMVGKTTSANMSAMKKSVDQKKVPNDAILDMNTKLSYLDRLHLEIGNLHLELGHSFDSLGQDIKGIYGNHDNSRKQLKNALEELTKRKKDQEKKLESAKKEFELYVSKWEDSINKRIQFVQELGKPNRTATKRKSAFNILGSKPSIDALQDVESKYANKTGDRSKKYQKEISSLIAFYQNFYRIHLPKVLHSMMELSNELADRYKWAWGMYWKEVRKVNDQKNLIYGGLDEAGPMTDIENDFEHLVLNREPSFQLSPTDPEIGEDGALQTTVLEIIQKFNLEKDLADFIRFSYNNNSKNFLEHIEEMHVVTKNDSRLMNETPSDVIYTNFGVDLQYICDRDDVNLPRFLEELLNALDRYNERVDIYQSTESHDAIISMRNQLNKHAPSVDYRNVPMPLLCDMILLFFRELPDGLIPNDMIQDFMAAVKTDDNRRRIIGVHDCVNKLPDSNYCTLKALMLNLNK
eukprot:NODE_83_length_22684_cov_0.307934.p1 type:complete len:565 gc:universal NODE_83_length_22684_cov_0.307934:4888-3194(-)